MIGPGSGRLQARAGAFLPEDADARWAMPTAPTLLFIAGKGRSGSTFLGHVLGQIKGFAFVGEAMRGPRALDDRLCGCGVPLDRCDFWTAVRREASAPAADDFFALGLAVRWRHLPASYACRRADWVVRRYGDHGLRAGALYRAAAALSGASIIVDSSKSVPYARMLMRASGLEVRLLHLVRDARAMAHSWARPKVAPDRPAGEMIRRHPSTSALYWNAANLGSELVGRAAHGYLRLRYEDLARRPVEVVERIAQFATERRAGDRPLPHPIALPFVDERTVELGPTHSITGNPDRLRTGPVAVRLDDRWRREMTARDRGLVTALTWPLLVRYGYLPRIAGPR
jgi:hypothetical protein